MQIVACIKQVPDTTQVQIDPVTNTLVREGIPFIVNPYDTHALEESLRLKDSFGFSVSAISMGPPNAEATLRKVLALGVDRAILLSDRVFDGADTLATSNVLTEAIRRLNEEEKVGIIFCGKQTIDGDTAQVGPGIAMRLGMSQLTLVDQVADVDPEKLTVTVRRKLEGRKEIWAAADLQKKTAVQGHLCNLTLIEGGQRMRDEVAAILKTLGKGPFIFNLAHGVLPQTPPEHVAELVRLVRGQR